MSWVGDTRVLELWRNGTQLALINTCNLPFIPSHHTQHELNARKRQRRVKSRFAIASFKEAEAINIHTSSSMCSSVNACLWMCVSVYMSDWNIRQTLFTHNNIKVLALFSLWTQNWCTFWNFYRLNVQMNTYLLGGAATSVIRIAPISRLTFSFAFVYSVVVSLCVFFHLPSSIPFYLFYFSALLGEHSHFCIYGIIFRILRMCTSLNFCAAYHLLYEVCLYIKIWFASWSKHVKCVFWNFACFCC